MVERTTREGGEFSNRKYVIIVQLTTTTISTILVHVCTCMLVLWLLCGWGEAILNGKQQPVADDRNCNLLLGTESYETQFLLVW